MPELPEVETTRRGLQPLLEGRMIDHAVVRNRAMRRPVPRILPGALHDTRLERIARRGKYLLFECTSGTLIIHLGMSGRLWAVAKDTLPERHDHFDLVMADGTTVRLRDPRRFGLVLWQRGDGLDHPLLRQIGPEPLAPEFDGTALHAALSGLTCAVKLALMDSHRIAGIGNIYASEALFRARINPRTAAGRVSLARCEVLAREIKHTLQRAIRAGGSSLRDYVGSDGKAGYFQSEFTVYGRAGEPCMSCAAPIRSIVQGQRATYYCARCQR